MLIDNAGLTRSGPLLELPLDDAREIMETNVLGVLAVSQVRRSVQ